MSSAGAILQGIEWLLSPETPVWVKVLVGLVFLALIAGWWTRPFWHDLDWTHTPSGKRQARPPF